MSKTTIEINRLGFFAYHGATEEEARLGQRFFLDVTLQLVDGLSFAKDDVTGTVNYAEVYQVVKASFTDQRFNLIERAAESIAEAVLADFELVEEVSVRVEKPSAPVDCVCDAFAVEISKCR